MTVRELSAAERYFARQLGAQGNYPLTATLRTEPSHPRLGRIGMAIARRLDPWVPVDHTRRPRTTSDIATSPDLRAWRSGGPAPGRHSRNPSDEESRQPRHPRGAWSDASYQYGSRLGVDEKG